MADLSPMMKQYLEIKQQHKDEILFYRIGDFYEMFYDDAITASRELDLTLTGQQCGQKERAPMCGVPLHSPETYRARLIAQGYKVAICEQTEDPASAKGLVKRDIIRVVTPGTVIDSASLEEGRSNFLAGVFLDGRYAGVCFCDITTGKTHATAFSGGDLNESVANELGRFHPVEAVVNDGAYGREALVSLLREKVGCRVEN